MKVYLNRKALVLFLTFVVLLLYGLFLFNSKASSHNDDEKKILELTKKIDSVKRDYHICFFISIGFNVYRNSEPYFCQIFKHKLSILLALNLPGQLMNSFKLNEI